MTAAVVAEAVRRQARRHGIDVVDDGEMSAGVRRYATYVKQRLERGFDGDDQPLALSEFADFPTFTMEPALDVTNPACTGPVAFHGRDALQTDIANLSAAPGGRPATEGFMNSASPGIICDYLADEYYGGEEIYLAALGDAMKHEYDAIASAGLVLQLDCPDLALWPASRRQPLDTETFRRKITQRIEVHQPRAARRTPAAASACTSVGATTKVPHHHDIPLAEIVDLILTAAARGLLVEAG